MSLRGEEVLCSIALETPEIKEEPQNLVFLVLEKADFPMVSSIYVNQPI